MVRRQYCGSVANIGTDVVPFDGGAEIADIRARVVAEAERRAK